jgi:hypothetical protein
MLDKYRMQEALPLDDGPHTAYWSTCVDCEAMIHRLMADGITRPAAAAIAEREHRRIALLDVCTHGVKKAWCACCGLTAKAVS